MRRTALLALVCLSTLNLELAVASEPATPARTPDQRLFPRVDRVVVDPVTGAPSWIHGDLGYLAGIDVRAEMKTLQPRLGEAFGLSPESTLEIGRTATDELGMTHIRLRQHHQGLPVDGGDLYLHVDGSGTLRTVNGHLAPSIDQPPLPKLDARTAMNLMAERLGAGELQVLESPQLVYLSSPGQPARLAWRAVVEWSDDKQLFQDRVYLDAVDSQLLARHGLLMGSLNREIYDARQGDSIPGTLMFTEGGSSADQIAMAAYQNTGVAYRFFLELFERDSWDNDGARLRSTVHFRFDGDPNNAAWSGYYGQLLFGDGDGSIFGPLATSLDITAHEVGHAVTGSSADLIYQDESGALNEAMSDIFGALCEAWHRGEVSADTWKLGEDVYTPGTSGDALRYMNNPTADGQSYDYYPERYVGDEDYGGVHLNSGIGNLAFYLLSQGGVHPRGKTAVSVPAIGMDKAREIFYRALTVYMTSSTGFEGARNATAQAAADLYGTSEVDAVNLAWDAVGVPGGSDPPQSNEDELSDGVQVSNLAGSQDQELHYFIDVPLGASKLELRMAGGSGDADLYVKHGSPPTTSSWDYRPYTIGNDETVGVPSPTAGRWHVMIHAYFPFSGVTLVASYSDSGGDGPCQSCELYRGSLSHAGDTEVQPGGAYYHTNSSGAHQAWLEGPSEADLDLYLYRWTSAAGWSVVDASTSETSSESISFQGPAGYYAWLVKSYYGSGSYQLWLKMP